MRLLHSVYFKKTPHYFTTFSFTAFIYYSAIFHRFRCLSYFYELVYFHKSQKFFSFCCYYRIPQFVYKFHYRENEYTQRQHSKFLNSESKKKAELFVHVEISREILCMSFSYTLLLGRLTKWILWHVWFQVCLPK